MRGDAHWATVSASDKAGAALAASSTEVGGSCSMVRAWCARLFGGIPHALAGAGLLSLVLLVLAGAGLTIKQASAASPAPQPEVVDLSLGSLVVSPGEPVEVETNILNSTTQEDAFAVVLRVDDVREAERTVLLPPGATRTIRFTVIRSDPGTHTVVVGPHAATFQVLSAQFQIRDLSSIPPVVAPGEPVRLRATVENVGAALGIFQVPLAVNGVLLDVRSGLLAVGESRVVTFETVARASGTYTVLVGNVPGVFTVVSPVFDVTIPSLIPISLPTTVGLSIAGTKLEITGNVVTLKTASAELEVTLPVRLESGDILDNFRDSVSGISYDGDALVIPIRNALYEVVARLTAAPRGVERMGNTAIVTADGLRLVVPEALLQLPQSSDVTGSVSFGMEVPLTGLSLDRPFRLTPGRRHVSETLARIELAASNTGKTVVGTVASASVTGPNIGPASTVEDASVTFGVPSDWWTRWELGSWALQRFTSTVV